MMRLRKLGLLLLLASLGAGVAVSLHHLPSAPAAPPKATPDAFAKNGVAFLKKHCFAFGRFSGRTYAFSPISM